MTNTPASLEMDEARCIARGPSQKSLPKRKNFQHHKSFTLASDEGVAKIIHMLTDGRMEHSMQHLSHLGHSSRAHPCNRRSCLFTGRVQGVGFRYTVKNIVLQHNISGYVRNLPDGRVELVMEGPDDEMDQVIEAVNARMNDYIKQVDLKTSPASGEFDYFNIRH